MKLYKSLFIVAAIVGIVLTSCSEDGYWKEATPADRGLINGTAFAFNSKTSSYTYYPADVTEGVNIPVTITRGNTKGSFVLPVDAAFSDTSYLSGPDSVVFTEGSNSATYLIHIKKEIEIGKTVTANLVIDTLSVGIPKVEMPEAPELLDSTATAADSAQYEIDYAKFQADSIDYKIYLDRLAAYNLAITVEIVKDYNWISLGTGTWNDEYFYEAPGVNVQVLQAQENPKMFRVMLDFDAVAESVDAETNGNQSAYTNITLLEEGDELMGAAITEPNLVYWTKIKNGYDNDGVDWVYMHPMDFSRNWARYNSTSYVDSYQENGLPAKIVLNGLILLEGTSSGYAPCQGSTPIASVVFPGVKIYDYSASIQYAGLYTNPDNEVFVLADLKISGADAKNAKAMAVVVPGDADAGAVADAIAAGDLEATEVEEGRLQLPMPEEAGGKMQIVVAIIADDEVGNVVTTSFEYYAGANPWVSLGMGLYTDDLIYPLYTQGNPSVTYEVEIQEHSETPGLFRLVDPYGEAFPYNQYAQSYNSTMLIVHAEDPDAVYIFEQSTGLDLGDGEMSISTVGGEYYAYHGDDYYDMLKQYGYFGTLEDGVMTFPSFEEKDEATDEVKYTYQGFVTFAGEDGSYSMGNNGELQIVLPSAVSVSARKAAKFAGNLNAFNKNWKKSARKGLKAESNKSFSRIAKQYKMKKAFKSVIK